MKTNNSSDVSREKHPILQLLIGQRILLETCVGCFSPWIIYKIRHMSGMSWQYATKTKLIGRRWIVKLGPTWLHNVTDSIYLMAMITFRPKLNPMMRQCCIALHKQRLTQHRICSNMISSHRDWHFMRKKHY